jgi:hypothetical protein
MAELADAADSKSADPCDRGGSTPPPGTNVYLGFQRNGLSVLERQFWAVHVGISGRNLLHHDNQFSGRDGIPGGHRDRFVPCVALVETPITERCICGISMFIAGG